MSSLPSTFWRFSLLGAGILLWWGLSHAGHIPAILLPTPELVAATFVKLIANGQLQWDTLSSLARVLAGFLIAATSAMVLAWSVSQSPRLALATSLPLNVLRVVPPLSLIPLLILWLGIGEAPKIAIVVLASFFPIYLSIKTALLGVPQKLLEVGRVLGFTPQEMRNKIILPSALPGLLTGLRLGFGYAWRALVGAELIAASSGLGYLINESADFGKTDAVFVGILSIALLGILADALLGKAIRVASAHLSGERRAFERGLVL